MTGEYDIDVGWISVDDTIPRPRHIVLIWLNEVQCVSTASIQRNGTGFEWHESGARPGEAMTRHVSHWRPCPKGPKP